MTIETSLPATGRRRRRRGLLAPLAALVALAASPAAAVDDQTYLLPRINQALETQKSNVEIPWFNPDTGSRGMIVVERTFFRDLDTPCREYRRTLAPRDAQARTIKGIGCRIGSGVWDLDEETVTARPTPGQAAPSTQPARPAPSSPTVGRPSTAPAPGPSTASPRPQAPAAPGATSPTPPGQTAAARPSPELASPWPAPAQTPPTTASPRPQAQQPARPVSPSPPSTVAAAPAREPAGVVGSTGVAAADAALPCGKPANFTEYTMPTKAKL